MSYELQDNILYKEGRKVAEIRDGFYYMVDADADKRGVSLVLRTKFGLSVKNGGVLEGPKEVFDPSQAIVAEPTHEEEPVIESSVPERPEMGPLGDKTPELVEWRLKYAPKEFAEVYLGKRVAKYGRIDKQFIEDNCNV